VPRVVRCRRDPWVPVVAAPFWGRLAVAFGSGDGAHAVEGVGEFFCPGAAPAASAHPRSILGRLGDPTRFANLAAVRSFAGLVPAAGSSGQADGHRGPTKAGDCCLREAPFIAADHARKVDPTLAVRYQRLMLAGKHHDSAVATLAAVLLTRIAACLRAATHYLLRDTDGRVITETQGRAIVAERYTVPPEVRAARRTVTPHRHPRRNERNERAKTGVAARSQASPVPQPA
jgi:Transposase IS116/IS110/IS902 family